MTQSRTIDDQEVEKFAAMAEEWWDPFGKFKPLHKFNPVRLAALRDRLCAHFGRDRFQKRPLEGLRLLDIGCGGGLVSEPMARLGAEVVGIDPADRNIKIAEAHRRESGVNVDYRTVTVERLVAEKEPPFDIVLSLEAVEHVADPAYFLSQGAALVRPGGLMAVATLNRTLKSLLTAKIAAEYILRWLPAGTHDPRKFLKPAEIAGPLRQAGLTVTEEVGFSYNPLFDSWRESDDLEVNYLVVAHRPEAADPPASRS
ncbi:putative 3-demethylubiquinone-9 3-methyltransferase protein [Parvularcula bermudensis HTCC2503]|uniref:Ubiquinone biosynthesis O-methyltransferase n=1 Tax=Parvularcula bermudensis (strain ATCC BAA-594 / HTCC2503 / KCTC 12087) TaxID=314260 RepID=E0TG20_PARBH|nr:bifunctional 2-polyprenyl-6-hydroxyphenol methylase/3-demethylubiquinol 3-O-methyltransferase UbiG [Parvularcula bermudensis]ADM10591.1 putative 3-demethylubiquinone-9 3-methyltransferase protein [Parvularcula bermudensis HTCC2503]